MSFTIVSYYYYEPQQKIKNNVHFNDVRYQIFNSIQNLTNSDLSNFKWIKLIYRNGPFSIETETSNDNNSIQNGINYISRNINPIGGNVFIEIHRY